MINDSLLYCDTHGSITDLPKSDFPFPEFYCSLSPEPSVKDCDVIIFCGVPGSGKDYIAEKGFDKQYGARPLKRAIQKYIEDALAEEIVSSHLQEGDKINIDLDKKEQELKITIGKAEKPTES